MRSRPKIPWSPLKPGDKDLVPVPAPARDSGDVVISPKQLIKLLDEIKILRSRNQYLECILAEIREVSRHNRDYDRKGFIPSRDY